MLDKIYSTVSKKNFSLNQNSKILNIVLSKQSYDSIFTELKKKLLKKEIEFNNFFSNKKKYDDKNIISTHFFINNLINLLNKQDAILDFDKNDNFENKNTQKKKQTNKIKIN